MSNRRQTWTFNVTSAMAPKAKVVLYYVRSDGEVVADVSTVNVQGVFQNKVLYTFYLLCISMNINVQMYNIYSILM
jgi:hypothetical protein